jgi:hypothetical protein
MASLELGASRLTLVGRDRECAAIDRALRAASTGESTALVIRGDPGMGKTALLAYAADRAAGSSVLHASGIEGESDLAFAGLHAAKPDSTLTSGSPARRHNPPSPRRQVARSG